MSQGGRTGRRVNRADLASLTGASLVTIDNWVRRGMPFVQRGSKGREWIFDTAQCIEWLRQQDVEAALGDTAKIDYDEARRRKMAADAALAEYELAKARRTVITVEEATAMIADDYARCRRRLMEIPGRLSQRLAGESDPAAVERMLKDDVTAALEELTADAGDDDGDGAGSA